MVSSYSVLLFEIPSVLWALCLMSIPIIVHLFNLRKAKRLEFSNIALLKKVTEETNAKRRPIELLILLMRIMTVVLIIIGFAQPILKNDELDRETNDDTTVYLDTSLSMSKTRDNQSSFDRAYSLVTGLAESYPNGVSFRLIDNGYISSVSTKLSKSALENSLTTLNQVGVDRTATELVSRINSLEESRDVYWFSDFNATSDIIDLADDTIHNHYLVPVFGDEQPNIFIDSVYLQNTFYSGENVNNIVVNLAATDRISRSVNLRFSVADKLLGTARVDFSNTDNATYNYSIPSGTKDLSMIKLELDGADPNYDNEFFLSINDLEEISVLEVYDSESNGFISSLYDANELFSFQRSNSNTLQLPLFESADFLILNELSSYSNQLVNYVGSFIRRGGTILILPNSEMDSSEFQKIEILVQEDDNNNLSLNPIDFENPFFEGIFEEEDVGIRMPKASTQWRPINYESALLRFSNERPFLAKLATSGSVYFFASSLADEYSNFATHAIFVPIMYKLALGAQSEANRLYYQTDSEFMTYTIDENSNEVYKLRSVDAEIVPDQRIMNGQLLMVIPKDQIKAGQYYLTGSTDTIGVMSFNLPKSESIYNENITAQLEELSKYDHIRVLNLESKDQAMSFVNDNLRGKSLWRYFIIAALFFLFAEIILIRYL